MLPSKYKTRREFIKTSLRFGVGGGLIFGGIALGLREKTANSENDLCQVTSPCRGCSKYSGCSLPRAQNTKKDARGDGGTHVRK